MVVFTVLGVLGLFSYSSLKYELLPKMTPPVISVITQYPGASPSEVENSVTRKIEDVVSSLERVQTVRSNSSEGVSVVIVEFTQDADIDQMVQDAQRRTQAIVENLPEDAKTPTIFKFAIDELPILQLAVTANIENKKFYQLVKDQIQPRINKVPGVGQLTLIGGEEREIRVNVNPDKLRAYNLSLMQVVGALQSSNLDFPTGNVKDKDNQLIVRVAGKVQDLEQMKSLVISRTPTGGNILLSDIAEVQDGIKEITKINRLNGVSSIGLALQKQSDANAVEVSKLVRAELAKIEGQYKDINLKFDIGADTTEFTIDAADAVIHDLELAVVLVAFVMLVFLHSLRSALIVMVSIPASLVSTMLGMYLLDFSLNLMTLLALSLVIGILVDDSIVVLENIHRHLEMGKDKRKAALDGRNEIGFTALSITLVDVVVFFPLALQTGIIGNIMREFSLVVVISTLMSLVVSFTITPVLASRFAKHTHLTNATLGGRLALGFEHVYGKLVDAYGDLLAWCIKRWYHGLLVGVIALGALFGSFALVAMGLIGGEFITKADRGEFAVQFELGTGVSIEYTNDVVREMENTLLKLPYVAKIATRVGTTNSGLLNAASANIAEMTVTLKPKEQRTISTSQVQRQIREMLVKIPGVKGQVRDIGIFGSADEAPLQLSLIGINRDSIAVAANRVQAALESIKGATDIDFSSENGKPELLVDIDRTKMAQYGLAISDVGSVLRTALTGYDGSKYRDGDSEYDIRVSFDRFDRTNAENIKELTFLSPANGRLARLDQFAVVRQSSGPSKLERRDRLPALTINANVMGRPNGDVGNELEKLIQTDPKYKLPAGVEFAWEGQIKNQRESNSSMGLAFIVSILFVYLIMVALYDSYVYPLVVLFSIPLAMIGALLALAMSMSTINIFTMLGIVMLIGLVAKNAILLVDFTNHRKAEGLSTREALIESGRDRLRPILMTTLAMAIGMLPIALATGAGAEWKKGLAWALIGGLTSSMFLTLLVVPVVYLFFDRILEKLGIKTGYSDEVTEAIGAKVQLNLGPEASVAFGAPAVAPEPVRAEASASEPASEMLQK